MLSCSSWNVLSFLFFVGSPDSWIPCRSLYYFTIIDYTVFSSNHEKRYMENYWFVFYFSIYILIDKPKLKSFSLRTLKTVSHCLLKSRILDIWILSFDCGLCFSSCICFSEFWGGLLCICWSGSLVGSFSLELLSLERREVFLCYFSDNVLLSIYSVLCGTPLGWVLVFLVWYPDF